MQSRKFQNNYLVFKLDNSIKIDKIVDSLKIGTKLYAELYRLRVSQRGSSPSPSFFTCISTLSFTPLPP